MNRRDSTDERTEYTRRETLRHAGGLFGTATGLGTLTQRVDESYADQSDDGIPDLLKESESFHQYVEDLFGADQFDGLDPERKDLLLDVRYVGRTTISETTKTRIEDRFRSNGIYVQWLDYPQRYGQDAFETEYGYNGERILWPNGSFYDYEVEDELKNVAVQVIVVPSEADANANQHLHATFHTLSNSEGGDFSGMSFGNRAVVTDQDTVREEVGLIMHEVAHLALCHDESSENTGVMGPVREEADLMDYEWEKLRENLDNVRDQTGYDIALRPCIWREYYDEVVGEEVEETEEGEEAEEGTDE